MTIRIVSQNFLLVILVVAFVVRFSITTIDNNDNNTRHFFVSADTRHHRRDDVTGHIPSTHEEIISRRAEHHSLFSGRLEEVVAKLNLHSTGERLLTEAEYNRLNRKKKAYKNKLEELSREFDERHSRRIMHREELLNDMTKARMERSSKEEL